MHMSLPVSKVILHGLMHFHTDGLFLSISDENVPAVQAFDTAGIPPPIR